MSYNRYIIPFSWAWSSAALVSGVLGALLSGWTLLHSYTPLFVLTIGVFGGSLLIAPSLIAVGIWEWRTGKASARVFLLHFLLPQLLVVVGFLIGYVTESIRTHTA